MKDLFAYGFGFLLVGFAAGWTFLDFAGGAHTTPDNALVGGCLLGAFFCVAPASAERAINALKAFNPWGKKE